MSMSVSVSESSTQTKVDDRINQEYQDGKEDQKIDDVANHTLRDNTSFLHEPAIICFIEGDGREPIPIEPYDFYLLNMKRANINSSVEYQSLENCGEIYGKPTDITGTPIDRSSDPFEEIPRPDEPLIDPLHRF